MKLLTQTSLYMVTLSLFLFFASGVAFYFVFRSFTNHSLERDLDQERIEVLSNPELFLKAVQDSIPFFNRMEFEIIDGKVSDNFSFSDSIVLSINETDYVPVRIIKFYSQIRDNNYEVKIYKSKISSDDLTVRITGLITLLAFFFTAGIFLLNRFGFKQTWKDFQTSLLKVQRFKAGSTPPAFESTEIEEFDALNQELEKMTNRISRDYHNLESFTTHTTHEFQTPLAVIRSKVELLLQSENLSPEQMKEIQNIDKYAGQLSRLNQSLSLLFKIENQQFDDSSIFDLSEILEPHMEFLTEQTAIRDIKLNLNINTKVNIRINRSLADILLLNIIRNSVFHNFQGGFITITLEPGKLSVSNSGNPPDNNEDNIFKEFVKGKNSNGSGLGLAIVKRICDQYGINLNYRYNNKIHSLILILP